MIEKILTLILSTGVAMTVPILFSALGEIYDQRAGVLNLGLEGIMTLSAFVALLVGFSTGSYLMGTLAAISVGALMALIYSFACVKIGINQIIAGLLLVTLANGIADFSYASYIKLSGVPRIAPLQPIDIPGLNQIPVLGPVLFRQNIFVYLAFLFAIVFGFVLYKTTWGLKIRGAGENPEACDAAGINVNRIRYLCVILSGVMAGFGGAFLTLGYSGLYGSAIAGGRGWIAIIVVILSCWSPYRAILGSLIFGMGYSTANTFIGIGIGVSSYVLQLVPYATALIIIIFMFKRTKGPSALTVPYRRK